MSQPSDLSHPVSKQFRHIGIQTFSKTASQLATQYIEPVKNIDTPTHGWWQGKVVGWLGQLASPGEPREPNT